MKNEHQLTKLKAVFDALTSIKSLSQDQVTTICGGVWFADVWTNDEIRRIISSHTNSEFVVNTVISILNISPTINDPITVPRTVIDPFTFKII